VTIGGRSTSSTTGTATVETDGAATLTLARLAPGTKVTGAAAPVVAGRDGSATIALRQGTTRLVWRRAG
jgi:hypothetical protein